MAKHFSVDARAMLTWGRESIKDHTTAVLELVKNSYDAGATIVEVQIWTGLFADGGRHIRIADDGVGMSSDDVENYWLRLGYSAKREDKFTPRGRRRTEEGVGRISPIGWARSWNCGLKHSRTSLRTRRSLWRYFGGETGEGHGKNLQYFVPLERGSFRPEGHPWTSSSILPRRNTAVPAPECFM